MEVVAILFFTTLQNVADVRVVVKNTTFTDNIALLGPAMFAFKYQSLVNHRDIYLLGEYSGLRQYLSWISSLRKFT